MSYYATVLIVVHVLSILNVKDGKDFLISVGSLLAFLPFYLQSFEVF